MFTRAIFYDARYGAARYAERVAARRRLMPRWSG